MAVQLLRRAAVVRHDRRCARAGAAWYAAGCPGDRAEAAIWRIIAASRRVAGPVDVDHAGKDRQDGRDVF